MSVDRCWVITSCSSTEGKEPQRVFCRAPAELCLSVSFQNLFFPLWSVVLMLLLLSRTLYFFLLWVSTFIAICWTSLFFIHFLGPINLNTGLLNTSLIRLYFDIQLSGVWCGPSFFTLTRACPSSSSIRGQLSLLYPVFSPVSRCSITTLSFCTDWALPCSCSHCLNAPHDQPSHVICAPMKGPLVQSGRKGSIFPEWFIPSDNWAIISDTAEPAKESDTSGYGERSVLGSIWKWWWDHLDIKIKF